MSQLNINNIKNKKGDFGPTLVGHSTVTGNLNVSGVISGDGSGLTGIANTEVIATANLTVNGPSAFNGTVNTNSVVNTNSTVNVDQGLIVTGTGASFRDNVKLNIGTGNDLEIYHDESNSFIRDVGTGSLYVQTDGPGVIVQKTDSENIAVFNSDSSVDLYYDGNKKFETRTDGAQVTGTIISDSVSSGSATFTGDVSIGGTLTYEDVTNVDSVGMVTARSGLQVLENGIDVTSGIITARSGIEVTGIVTARPGTAVTFYGDFVSADGSPVGGGGGGGRASTVSSINDGANGRLDTFGGGQFAVFTSPGTFDTTGITSLRARVVGAGSSGCYMQYTCVQCCCGYMCRTCYPFQGYPTTFYCNLITCYVCVTGIGAGAGGGYAHKVFDTPEIPGPGVFNVQIGQAWNCSESPTVGTSCFGDTLCASGGVGTVGGTGTGGDVNSTGGSPSFSIAGGAAGSQLGPGNSAQAKSCGSIVGINTSETTFAGTRSHWGVERFPFDIFTGSRGRQYYGPTSANTGPLDGCSGGSGTNAITITPAEVSASPGCYCAIGPSCPCAYLCKYPRPALTGANYLCLCCCSGGSQCGGNGGHGAGGGSSTSNFCNYIPSCDPNYPNYRQGDRGGDGGYGGGGGALITTYRCGGPQSCCEFGIMGGGWGKGGPGIVIVEW